MRVAAAAGVLVACMATPGVAQHGPVLPRLDLNGHVFRQTDRLVVRGTSCVNTGLGYGYVVRLTNGREALVTEQTDSGATGDWRAEYDLDTAPAGRYVLSASCHRALYPHDPVYPNETVTILPSSGVRADGAPTVSDVTPQPGQALRLAGSGFSFWYRVGVFWDGTYVESLPAPQAPANDVSGTVTVPHGATAGRHRVLLQGLSHVDNVLWTLVTYVDIPSPEPVVTSAPAQPVPESPKPEPTALETPTPTATPSPSAPAVTPEPSSSAPTTPPPAPAEVGFAAERPPWCRWRWPERRAGPCSRARRCSSGDGGASR